MIIMSEEAMSENEVEKEGTHHTSILLASGSLIACSNLQIWTSVDKNVRESSNKKYC